jgi:hypothetical protein
MIVNLDLKRGDTGVWDIACKDTSGNPLNLTGAVVSFYAKTNDSDADTAAVVHKDSAATGGIVITDAGNGLARVTIDPADTASFTSAVILAYEVRVTDQSGTITTVVEGSFSVSTNVGTVRVLAPVADVKAFLSLKANHPDDALIARLTVAASSWFESQTGRSFASASSGETFVGNGSRYYAPKHFPVSTVSGFLVNGIAIPEAVAETDSGYRVLNDVIVLSSDYRFTDGLICSVSYTAGPETVPADVTQAVIEIAAERYKYMGRVGELSKSTANGSVSFVSFQIPAFVQSVIDTYRVYRV